MVPSETLQRQPELAERHRLIRYHRRGWVGSSHTPPPVTIGHHAADSAALPAHLGVRGRPGGRHSSGAAVAAELALGHPDTVHTLLLLEPVPRAMTAFLDRHPMADR